MKYEVTEERILVVKYIIEAESEEAAKKLDGEILSEEEIDNHGYHLKSCKELIQSNEFF